MNLRDCHDFKRLSVINHKRLRKKVTHLSRADSASNPILMHKCYSIRGEISVHIISCVLVYSLHSRTKCFDQQSLSCVSIWPRGRLEYFCWRQFCLDVIAHVKGVYDYKHAVFLICILLLSLRKVIHLTQKKLDPVSREPSRGRKRESPHTLYSKQP